MYSIQSDCRGSDPCILPFWTEALEKTKEENREKSPAVSLSPRGYSSSERPWRGYCTFGPYKSEMHVSGARKPL